MKPVVQADISEGQVAPRGGGGMMIMIIKCTLLNPLRAKSHPHQFSPHNIHTLPREKVMRFY